MKHSELPQPDNILEIYNHVRDLRAEADGLVRRIAKYYPMVLVAPCEERLPAIQKMVAAYFCLDLSVMASASRSSAMTWPRQVAMFFCREFTDASLNTIGVAFGGRNHGTVVHAVKAVSDRCEVVPATADSIKNLRMQLAAAFVVTEAKPEVAA